MLMSQSYQDFDISVVDNGSHDKTLTIASEYNVKYISHIDNYRPGLALNTGCIESSYEFYVFLSAHCIPTDNDWLAHLLEPLLCNHQVVGSYGRQLPLPSSTDIDKRDLFMTFRSQSYLQTIDPFFHNANSAVRASYFLKNKFCESTSNAEDHLWGKSAIDNGMSLYYSASASVFHHHGLHQGNAPSRVSGVLRSLEAVHADDIVFFPQSLTLSSYRFCLLVLIPSHVSEDSDVNRVFKVLSQLLESNLSICSIALIYDPSSLDLSSQSPATLTRDIRLCAYDRSSLQTPYDSNLVLLLQEVQSLNESQSSLLPDGYIYLNASYLFLSSELVLDLACHALSTSADQCHLAYEIYDSLWSYNQGSGYRPIDKTALLPKHLRNAYLNVPYGLGSFFTAAQLRNYSTSQDPITSLLRLTDASLLSKKPSHENH